MKKHKYNIFPVMLPDDYNRLKDDLSKNGYDSKNPIYTYLGEILDGWNRYQACTELGIQPVYREFSGSDFQALDFVMRTNKRRNLTSSQWAAIAVEAEEVVSAIREQVEKRHRERQSENAVNQFAQPKVTSVHSERSDVNYREKNEGSVNKLTLPNIERNESRLEHKIATTFNTNRTYINEATKLKNDKPELFAKVKTGEVTITQAQREVKRAEIIESLNSIEAQEAKEVDGVFDVVVVDPPWPMKKIERDVRPNQSEFDYPVMTEEELSDLSLPMADNCHVWLWTTHKFIPMAFRLLNKWGLNYVCMFTWHKPGGFQPMGLPQYNSEFAIYARKGTPIFVDTKSFNTCFSAPRGSHSEKPNEFYEMVCRVTAGRRIDMFNRRKIYGFETWGKESYNGKLEG